MERYSLQQSMKYITQDEDGFRGYEVVGVGNTLAELLGDLTIYALNQDGEEVAEIPLQSVLDDELVEEALRILIKYYWEQ